MPPGLAAAASVVASPRAFTSCSASSNDRLPQATRAEYSPSEWPIVRSPSTPASRATRQAATEFARIAGWQCRVSISSSCGPSKQMRARS